MKAKPARPLDDQKYRSDAARWNAVVERDQNADGYFFYSVKSTGVYCRPSCRARAPQKENVQFHLTCEAAEAAGFRPCKRCRPNGPSLKEIYADLAARACRMIQSAETPPALATLAKELGMSSFHFHRVFKEITGVTPQAYATARRAQRVRQELTGDKSVTEAIFAAGYNSNSRFYEKSSAILGMQPNAYRNGGGGHSLRFAIGQCSLGCILVAASDKGICAITLGDDPDFLVRDLQDRFPKAHLIGGDRDFERVVSQVVGFVEKPQIGLNLPLDVRGTAFQQRVWQALRKIPLGKTASYTDIAKQVGMPKAVRAVAQACGANSLAVVIPCHRVIRTDGNISGYRWGVERKRLLLEKEKV